MSGGRWIRISLAPLVALASWSLAGCGGGNPALVATGAAPAQTVPRERPDRAVRV